MAAKNKALAVGAAAESVRSNEYVQRLIEDDELRENIQEAYDSARAAYERIAGGKSPAKTLLDDNKVHAELENALASLHEATQMMRGKRDKSRRWTKVLAIALIGAGLALVLSEDVRKTVLDKLFGAEEEFEYTPTTTPAGYSSAPSSGATSPSGGAAKTAGTEAAAAKTGASSS
ncbi:MAG: hypothetical protein ACR2NA_00295 [Solirubrobacterales bacterium]